MQTEDQEEDDTLMNPDQFFFQLWEGAAELAQDVESPANIAEHYGQVWAMLSCQGAKCFVTNIEDRFHTGRRCACALPV